MMDYYQSGPQGQKTSKVAKSINTNVVLYLGELPKDVDQYELHQFIMAQGKFNVESLIVKPTKENKSFAYVKFKTKAEVERAKNALHLKSLRDYVIKAEPFRQKDTLKEESTKNKITLNSNTNLFVKNLPLNTTPKELYELFSKFGDIISIKLKQDKNGECLGYGYVNYESASSAEEALKNLNDYEHLGKKLYVSEFSSKKERSVSSGIDDKDKFPLVLVKVLPPSIKDEKTLQDIFSKFGQINFCGLVSNHKDKNNTSIDQHKTETKMGVILFANKEDASDAVLSLNETTINHDDTKFVLSLAPINKETIEKLWKAKQELYKTKYEGCNLVVKNIPKEISERNLFELCKQFGDLAVARIATEGKMKVTKDENGNVLDKEFVYESKGYGFVLYKNGEDAKKAKEALEKGIEFKGMKLTFVVEYYDYSKSEKGNKDGNGKGFGENRSPNKKKFNNNPNYQGTQNNQDNPNFQNKKFSGNNHTSHETGNNNRQNYNNQNNQNKYFNNNPRNANNESNEQTKIINNRTVIPPRMNMMNNNKMYQNPNQTSNQNPNQTSNQNQMNQNNFPSQSNFQNQNTHYSNNKRNMNMNKDMNSFPPQNKQAQVQMYPQNPNQNLNQNIQRDQNIFNPNMNPQMNQINSQMSQISPFGNTQVKSAEDIEFINEVSKIFRNSNSDEKTESLGETVFYYLLRFISKFNLNISKGRFDDPTLCSKLTGMFLSIEEKDLLEIFSNQEVLTMTINDVLMQLMKAP